MSRSTHFTDENWITVHTNGIVRTTFGTITISDRRYKPYKAGMIYQIALHRTEEHETMCAILTQMLGKPSTWRPGYRNNKDWWSNRRARGGWVRSSWDDWYGDTQWARDPVRNIWLSDWNHVRSCTMHHRLAEAD